MTSKRSRSPAARKTLRKAKKHRHAVRKVGGAGRWNPLNLFSDSFHYSDSEPDTHINEVTENRNNDVLDVKDDSDDDQSKHGDVDDQTVSDVNSDSNDDNQSENGEPDTRSSEVTENRNNDILDVKGDSDDDQSEHGDVDDLTVSDVNSDSGDDQSAHDDLTVSSAKSALNTKNDGITVPKAVNEHDVSPTSNKTEMISEEQIPGYEVVGYCWVRLKNGKAIEFMQWTTNRDAATFATTDNSMSIHFESDVNLQQMHIKTVTRAATDFVETFVKTQKL